MTRNCRRCGDRFETDRAHHRLCWACYWELRDGDASWRKPPPGWESPPRREPARAVSALDARLLQDAISLTHPDRHPPERARIANAVTAALLELLNAAKRAA
jgi:hypothetical protein